MRSSITRPGVARRRWRPLKPRRANLQAGAMIQLDRHDATRLSKARGIVRDLGSVLVAYSGGVDSTLLLKLALDELGEGAVGALASSPAYPETEQEQARAVARQLG